MKPFALLVDYEVLEYILRQKRSDGDAIRQRLLQIRDFPGNFSDGNGLDSSGRSYHLHHFGTLVIKCWIDDADRLVKIMRIGPANRK